MVKILGQDGNPINTTTETAVVTKTNKEDKILFIQTPIFILFAEYLGYVSPFISFAEDWCDDRKPMPTACVQTLLEREARSIYDDMLGFYTESQVRKLYEKYFPCGLGEIECQLIEKRKANGDDLPF